MKDSLIDSGSSERYPDARREKDPGWGDFRWPKGVIRWTAERDEEELWTK